ncbi:uncharacterized protein LOC134745881 [Cydia strobilella]|uniref:uncharacterized protein LOC134745881 n=1 Tax=Cydia strobilella TaxID=1100964 RepID=UPI003007DCD3
MGSGASVAVDTPGGDLRLPTSGLKFNINQLRALNGYVDSLYDDDQKDRMSTGMESAVESLVQRIVDGAGQRDPRFRCCHLIALHRGKKMRSRSLEYLVTLDSMSVLNDGNEDYCLQEGPTGYGRVRLTGKEAEKWEEFLTPSGYLCRDKVLERWVELIARCAHARGGGGSRVLCARAAARAHPHKYCYLERASPPQAMTDRRLAIVEGAAWVMVRVGAGEAEAKLMLGARIAGVSAAAYTCRVPLTSPLALLHYTAANQGYYATAVGPPSNMMCVERAATWQLWHPSLEATLDAHFSELSTIARVAGALNSLLDKMREGIYQGSLRGVSRYMAQCALRRRVDRCAAHNQAAARLVAQTHASHHLLLVLDSLLAVCERGTTAGYVYPVDRAALVRRGARGADWAADAATIRRCIMDLHRLPASEDILLTPSESLESVLFSRWEHLNRVPKPTTGVPSFTRRQLMYLWRVASELVACKNMVACENHSTFRANLLQVTSQHENIEQLIHILAIMLDQARDLYLNNIETRSLGEFDRDTSTYRSKKWNKLKDYYDASSACLIDAVRRDPELRTENLDDELNVMRNVLNWLYKGVKDDKKYLSPVLKPYLDTLFTGSLENSWFLEEFDTKKSEAEFQGLKEYCTGVHDGVIEPCLGLLDAAKKLAWAKAMVDFVDRYKHIEFRLVFPTGDGMAVSYPMKLPSRREHSAARELTLSRRDKCEAKLRLARRSVLGAFTIALVGDKRTKQHISRHGSSDEILASVKKGNYWRNNTKPDVIPSTSVQDLSSIDTLPKARRRSRRNRPATAYGFPEISITNQSDTKTMRRKYHTLKNLVYSEPVENIKELRRRPRSAGSTVRNKEALSRPSLMETLDFINSVKDALCVEESGTSDAEDTGWSLSDEWLVGQTAPLAMTATRCGCRALHAALADLLPALLLRRHFTVLQELCSWLGDSSEGALFALHRLARAARSRSSERIANSWKLPELEGTTEAPQTYRARPPDYVSGDEAPQPPPLPRRSSRDKQFTKRYTDYLSPKLDALETHLTQLELATRQNTYTGVLNPVYDGKIRDKFNVKRSKSLGRSFSKTKTGLEINRYNITLSRRSGERTNDVLSAIAGTTDPGLGYKSNFFQRYNASVVGDSYKTSRVTID